MKKLLAPLWLFLAAPASAQTVGVPWTPLVIPCNAASWYVGSPNSVASDFWQLSLPPALWQITGNVITIPLPGSGQTETITETHYYASAETVEYWGAHASPPVSVEIEPAPQGGSSSGSHAVRADNQGEITSIGIRYIDFRGNTGNAPVTVEGVTTWTWTGGGSQPPMALCGQLNAVPLALP